MTPAPATSGRSTGLEALRRIGAVSDLLFLYECTTRDVSQLRVVADPLGLSVQAASHTFRGLQRRGFAELRDGRYRATVRGVEWLHATLGSLERDLADRLERLHIVRTTRALARAAIEADAAVMLAVEEGVLTARPGSSGPSRGRALAAARTGELVEVVDLEGIVPLQRGRVRVVVLPSDRVRDPSLPKLLRSTIGPGPVGLLAAQGLEAYHLIGRAYPNSPALRFGIASAVEEAAQVGVDSTIVVVDREAPRLLPQLEGTDGPPPEIVALPRGGRRRT